MAIPFSTVHYKGSTGTLTALPVQQVEQAIATTGKYIIPDTDIEITQEDLQQAAEQEAVSMLMNDETLTLEQWAYAAGAAKEYGNNVLDTIGAAIETVGDLIDPNKASRLLNASGRNDFERITGSQIVDKNSLNCLLKVAQYEGSPFKHVNPLQNTQEYINNLKDAKKTVSSDKFLSSAFPKFGWSLILMIIQIMMEVFLRLFLSRVCWIVQQLGKIAIGIITTMFNWIPLVGEELSESMKDFINDLVKNLINFMNGLAETVMRLFDIIIITANMEGRSNEGHFHYPCQLYVNLPPYAQSHFIYTYQNDGDPSYVHPYNNINTSFPRFAKYDNDILVATYENNSASQTTYNNLLEMYREILASVDANKDNILVYSSNIHYEREANWIRYNIRYLESLNVPADENGNKITYGSFLIPSKRPCRPCADDADTIEQSINDAISSNTGSLSNPNDYDMSGNPIKRSKCSDNYVPTQGEIEASKRLIKDMMFKEFEDVSQADSPIASYATLKTLQSDGKAYMITNNDTYAGYQSGLTYEPYKNDEEVKNGEGIYREPLKDKFGDIIYEQYYDPETKEYKKRPKYKDEIANYEGMMVHWQKIGGYALNSASTIASKAITDSTKLAIEFMKRLNGQVTSLMGNITRHLALNDAVCCLIRAVFLSIQLGIRLNHKFGDEEAGDAIFYKIQREQNLANYEAAVQYYNKAIDELYKNESKAATLYENKVDAFNKDKLGTTDGEWGFQQRIDFFEDWNPNNTPEIKQFIAEALYETFKNNKYWSVIKTVIFTDNATTYDQSTMDVNYFDYFHSRYIGAAADLLFSDPNKLFDSVKELAHDAAYQLISDRSKITGEFKEDWKAFTDELIIWAYILDKLINIASLNYTLAGKIDLKKLSDTITNEGGGAIPALKAALAKGSSVGITMSYEILKRWIAENITMLLADNDNKVVSDLIQNGETNIGFNPATHNFMYQIPYEVTDYAKNCKLFQLLLGTLECGVNVSIDNILATLAAWYQEQLAKLEITDVNIALLARKQDINFFRRIVKALMEMLNGIINFDPKFVGLCSPSKQSPNVDNLTNYFSDLNRDLAASSGLLDPDDYNPSNFTNPMPTAYTNPQHEKVKKTSFGIDEITGKIVSNFVVGTADAALTAINVVSAPGVGIANFFTSITNTKDTAVSKVLPDRLVQNIDVTASNLWTNDVKLVGNAYVKCADDPAAKAAQEAIKDTKRAPANKK